MCCPRCYFNPFGTLLEDFNFCIEFNKEKFDRVLKVLNSLFPQVVLYSLPELDGAIDTVVLGGLVGDTIGLVPERVRKMNQRLKGWVNLRRTPASERKIAIVLYGFPPNVGAVSTVGFVYLEWVR